MNKIAILKSEKSYASDPFNDDQYVIDFDRKSDPVEAGDLVCYVSPFYGLPFQLEFAVRTDGSFGFRRWQINTRENHYLHTDETPETFTATEEQIDTVNGLFSGRIRFEDLKLAVGGSVQKICPIDIKREEEQTGEPIYLA